MQWHPLVPAPFAAELPLLQRCIHGASEYAAKRRHPGKKQFAHGEF
jgi:hypothetical protein